MRIPFARARRFGLAAAGLLLVAFPAVRAQRAAAGSVRAAGDTLASLTPVVSAPAWSVGSSRAVIDSAEISHAAAATLSELIQTRAPSVSVFRSGGLLTQSGQIRMRGPTSAMSPALPLLVVDGVRMDDAQDDTITVQSRIDDVPLEDVARVELLRGPAAAALYGAGAASGAIVVTTRDAGAHPLRWRAIGAASASRSADDFLDRYQGIGTLTSSGTPTDGCGLSALAARSCTQTAIERRNLLAPSGFMRTGLGIGSSIEASGGSSATHGRLSVGRSGARGVTEDDQGSRTAARLDLTQRVVSSLEGTAHVSFVHGRSQRSRSDDLIQQLLLWRGPADTLGGVRRAADSLAAIPAFVGDLDHLTTAISLSWRPLSGIAVHAAASRDHVDERGHETVPSWAFVSITDTLTASREVRETRADVTAAHRVIGAAATALAGIEHQRARATSRGADYTGAGTYQITTSEVAENTNAVIGGERLVWEERAALGIGARYERDYLVGDAWRMYPTVDASYRLTSDWHGAAVRLRGAYGEAPQRALGPCSLELVPPPPNVYGDFYGCNRAPERSREGELGADATFRRGAVAVTAFRAAVSGVWLPVPAGLVPTIVRGRIRNQGIELDARGWVVDGARIRWDVGVTVSTLSDRIERGVLRPYRSQPGGGALANGQPVRGGVIQRYTFADTNADGILENDELQSGPSGKLGSSIPRLELALHSTLALGRRISLDAVVDGRRGVYAADQIDAAECARQQCLDLVSLSTSLADQARARVSTGPWNVENASFWRLREVGARWRLPARVTGATGAAEGSIVVAGQNLAMWTSFRGSDPEIDDNPRQAVARMVYTGIPLPREFLFRLELGYGSP